MESVSYSVSWGDTGRALEVANSGAIDTVQEKGWFPPYSGSNQAYMNSWQMGQPKSLDVLRTNGVYACRKVLSEEVSRLIAAHYEMGSDGGKVLLNSQISRLLRYPNEWQSRVSFWLGMMDSLLSDGNAYAFASRNDRGTVTAFTQVKSTHPYVDPETGAVFYGVGYNSSTPGVSIQDLTPQYMVPQRDILHLRLFTPSHPLVGESPLVAAAISASTGQAITNSSFSFFNRASRPSGYLKSPGIVNNKTLVELREAWESNYSGTGTGGVAVLQGGLDWTPLSMSAVDAEIVDQYRLTIEDVARIFRVPLFMLGNMDKATFNNVEQMTRSFYAGGLAFYLELIESELARFFGLPMNQVIEFDIEGGLMRSEFATRIEGLVKGVQGGVFTPNEARRKERLPDVEYGDNPLVQQQMVSLEYAASQSVDSEQPVSSEGIREMMLKRLNGISLR